MAEKYIAALSWPFLHKPAFALVIKVEWDASKPPSDYRADIVAEAEEISLPAMFKICRGLQEKYEQEEREVEWYGDAMNEAMVSLLFQAANGKPLPLAEAPYIDEPDAAVLYLQAIREITRNENKVLWFGEGSSLPGHLANLPKDKPIDISHFPPVAALGYAAAALYLWLQLEYERKPKTGPQRIIEWVERGEQSDDLLPWQHDGAEVAGYSEEEDNEGFLFGYE